MKVLCIIAVASIMCGCSNEVYVSEKGTINCQYTYPNDYEFDSIRTNDTTNGCKEVVIKLKKVEK